MAGNISFREHWVGELTVVSKILGLAGRVVKAREAMRLSLLAARSVLYNKWFSIQA